MGLARESTPRRIAESRPSSSMQIHTYQVDRGSETLHGTCRLPGDGAGEAEGWPAVLVVPDLLLSQQASFYPRLSEHLANRAYVLGINAISSGYLPGRLEPDVDRAEHYRLGSELADLVFLLTALRKRELPQSQLWDGQSLCIVGHGKGAALALHLERQLRVQGLGLKGGLALLCPPATLLRDGWPETGEARVMVQADQGRQLELAPGFLEDVRALTSTASLRELVACASWPLLFMVGEEARVFPVSETEELLRHANLDKDRFVVIEKAGHAFSAGDPSKGQSPALEEVFLELDRFLESLASSWREG
jgi:pimeloyl-ACP methyl ester carboxylesterase